MKSSEWKSSETSEEKQQETIEATARNIYTLTHFRIISHLWKWFNEFMTSDFHGNWRHLHVEIDSAQQQVCSVVAGFGGWFMAHGCKSNPENWH